MDISRTSNFQGIKFTGPQCVRRQPVSTSLLSNGMSDSTSFTATKPVVSERDLSYHIDPERVVESMRKFESPHNICLSLDELIEAHKIAYAGCYEDEGKLYDEEELYPESYDFIYGIGASSKDFNDDINALAAYFKSESGKKKLSTDLRAKTNKELDKLVEGPCRPLVDKLIDKGYSTVWSNAYGPGKKGVWWNKSDKKRFFTSLDDKTYLITRKDKFSEPTYKEYDPDIDLSDVTGKTALDIYERELKI